MKYGFSDYNLSVDDAMQELDNFANYGIDLGEKDHDKFFVDRWLKVRDTDLNEVDELKAEIEDLRDQLDYAPDEDELNELENEKEELEEQIDALKAILRDLKENYTVLDDKGNPVLWKLLEIGHNYYED